MIKIENLSVVRGGKTICAVDQLHVAAGERLAIVGPNGSGKTTLLRVIAGLSNDFVGECTVGGDRRERTYVHQHPLLFRGTALSNVRYGERGRAGDRPDARGWLRQLGIEQLADQSARTLSGGETRRVAIARALACRTKLLLLDEPLADLDDHAQQAVCDSINGLTDTTIVIASPTEVPKSLAVRTFHLS